MVCLASNSLTCSYIHPIGQSVAVIHNPPRITLHSVQDGSEERVLQITVPKNPSLQSNPVPTSLHATGARWFQQEKKAVTTAIPDIFKRNDVIVGFMDYADIRKHIV